MLGGGKNQIAAYLIILKPTFEWKLFDFLVIYPSVIQKCVTCIPLFVTTQPLLVSDFMLIKL